MHNTTDETEPGETGPGETQPEKMGFVAVQWAIEDRTDASQCKAYGAKAVELMLIDTKHNHVTRQVVPCERFDASIHVSADNYVGAITLIDENGSPVSEPLPLGPFEVSGAETTTRRVSFPAAEGRRDTEGQRDRQRPGDRQRR